MCRRLSLLRPPQLRLARTSLTPHALWRHTDTTRGSASVVYCCTYVTTPETCVPPDRLIHNCRAPIVLNCVAPAFETAAPPFAANAIGPFISTSLVSQGVELVVP